MTLNELIEAKKISFEEARVYAIFELNEAGRNWLKDMIYQTFQEQPPPLAEHYKNNIIAFLDGRRAVIREIMATIDRVKSAVNDENINEASEIE